MSEATLNRADILTRYRTRIAAQQRTRLTQAEQAALVDAFIDNLAQLDTPDAIEARCLQELTLLEEGYPTQTIASKLLAPYRKAIRAAIDAGRLPLNDATSHIVRYTKHATGEQQETQEHWALTHLKYDQQTYQELRDQAVAHNNQRQDDLQPVQVDPYLATVTEMLTEDEPHALTAAIAAATGRRHTEVVSRGVFEETQHPYVLRFSGQQKKPDATSETFDIVTIVPARSVLDALERLRQHPQVQALATVESVNSSEVRAFNSQVNRVVQRRFEETGIVPRIAGARSVSIHRLRGVYAAIAVYLWCPEGQHEHRFIQHYLGHLQKDANLPNSSATPHYFHYCLLDGDGQPLRAKGILRDTLGAPPHHSASETPEATPAPAHPPTRRPTLPVADLERFHHLAEQIGIDGSTAQRFHALLDWAEKGRQLPATSRVTPDQPEAAIDTSPAETAPEASEQAADAAETPQQAPEQVEQEQPSTPSPASPALESLPIISDQAKTLAWLTDEISSLRAQLAAAQQGSQDSRAWRDERSRMQAKIDSLTQENGILRKRLDRFDGLRQALWGSGEATPALDAPQAAQAAPAAPPRLQEHDQTSTPRATQTPTGAAPVTRGQERAARIWQTVQAWNDDPNRPTHEKVALSASTLETRFGLFRPTAKAWMQAHQSEVDQHNLAHAITSRIHNRDVPNHVWDTLKEQARA
jgi:hypothetical protein